MDTLPAPVLGDDPDQLLTQAELRALLRGISDRTLRAWAADGDAPPAIRLGKHLRYRVGDYRAWLAARVTDRDVRLTEARPATRRVNQASAA